MGFSILYVPEKGFLKSIDIISFQGFKENSIENNAWSFHLPEITTG